MSDRIDFAALPATPLNHFRLHFYAAVSHVFAAAARASDMEPIAESLQALSGYDDQLRACGVPALPATATRAWWHDVIAAWEREAHPFLPIRAVRSAIGVGIDDMIVVFAAGLVDEDARFGTLFERLNEIHGQRSQPRATAAVLAEGRSDDARADVRTALARLAACGLVRIVNGDAPRAQQALDVPALVWDVFRGERAERPAPWLRYLPPSALHEMAELILAAPVAGQLAASAQLVASGQVGTVIVRGPEHNGRRTALRAIARASGLGVLDVAGRLDDDRWRQLALLATATQAMPVFAWEAGPGERIEVQRPDWFAGPIGIAMGRSGGIAGHADRAITLTLGMPGVEERRARWRRELGGGEADAIANHFRTPSGLIVRLASLARAQAALAGRQSPAIDDVREASRLLNAQALDTLATRVPSTGDWTDLAVRDDTIRELLDLELRCRQREHGSETWTASGVRALFTGPSGTGKTLAARLLAAALRKDLYRVDLVVGRRTSTSARPRRTSTACSRAPRSSTSCCCSTKATRCSRSAPASQPPTTATRTSRPTSCCSGSRAFDGIVRRHHQRRRAHRRGVPAAHGRGGRLPPARRGGAAGRSGTSTCRRRTRSTPDVPRRARRRAAS